MSAKENQELMRWMYEEMSSIKGNAARVPAMLQKWMDPKGVYHSTTGDMNFEQYQKNTIGLLIAFPDLTMTVEDMIAAGDKVVTRYTARGTHKGPFMGVAATGKRFTMGAVGIARFVGGKAVEGWGFQDTFGLMQQLGVIPARK
jgi:predicted ester cyclase